MQLPMSLQRISASRRNIGASQMVLVVKCLFVSAGDARDVGSIPGSGRCPGERNGNQPQHSCLENFMDRGTWWATVHGVTKSQTRLNDGAHITKSDAILQS